ncbi:MAG TPA: transcriptional regulator NrdR [bacterium]|nr:transcriptional regulator NrdR [bacterium]HPN41946.1 transcriptional regulator NrdR [bacterium]
MKCPFCSYHDTRVIDSRTRDGGQMIRRRRECIKCKRRFTTSEQIDEFPLMIIKQDSRREEFDRKKLFKSIQVACIKRPVSVTSIEQIITKIEYDLRDQGLEEVKSQKVGEMVMDALKELDEVAYVRFASVYKNFQAKEEFIKELKKL